MQPVYTGDNKASRKYRVFQCTKKLNLEMPTYNKDIVQKLFDLTVSLLESLKVSI
jgi:hypothetical protein